jgi:hypothetical protein
MVVSGRSTTSVHDTLMTWGRPLGGRLRTNRSALAMLADGSLVSMYVHDAAPGLLAREAIRAAA